MENISEVDKIVLSYYNIPSMIEAYKLFYGQYPVFSEEAEKSEKEKMEYMMTILTEYDIYNCKKSNNYVYLDSPKFKIDLLVSKIKNIDNQEYELEKLCNEEPISELEKKGIKSLSYIIKNEIEEKNIENPIIYMQQLHNVLSYRSYAITLVNSSKGFKERIYKMAENIASRYKECDYKSKVVFEMINFIIFKLKLLPEKSNQNMDINEVIMEAENQGINYDSYIGLLSNKNKVFTK